MSKFLSSSAVRWRVTAGFTIALFTLPVLVDLAVSEEPRVFGYVAADAFYYFTVARNAADTGLFSFDQETLTNGFHPLWQVTLVPIFKVAAWLGVSDYGVVGCILLLNLGCIAAALFLLARVLRRGDQLHPTFLLLPVGAVAFLMAPLWLALGRVGVAAQSRIEGGRPLYATLWSYVNGMESGFVILLFAALAVLFANRMAERSRYHAVGFGVVLGLLGLARLDHLPLPIYVLVWLLYTARKDRDLLRRYLIAAAVFVGIISAYAITNLVWFGHPVPISGILKTTFPRFDRSDLDALSGLVTGNWPHLSTAVRLAQTVISALGAAIYLALFLRRRHQAEAVDQFLFLSALAVGTISAYNFAFVPTYGQGHWYYPMSTLWLSAVLVRSFGRCDGRRSDRFFFVWAVPSAIVTILVFIGLHRDTNYHRDFTAFYFEEVPLIRKHYGDQIPRIFSVDDGIIAFATGFPTMSGMGSNLDVEGVEYMRRGRLFDLAFVRGYDRITSIQYLHPESFQLRKGRLVDQSRVMRGFLGARLKNYTFLLDYRSESGRFIILRALPR